MKSRATPRRTQGDLGRLTAVIAMVLYSAITSNLPAAEIETPRVLLRPATGELSGSRASIFANLQARRTTRRLRVASFDREAFNGNRVELTLFPGRQVVAEKSDIGFTGILARSWTGRLADGGSAAFVIHGDRISGSISTVQGNFEIFPLGNGEVAVVEHDPLNWPECGNGQIPQPPEPAGLQEPILNTHDRFAATAPRRALAREGTAELADTPTGNRVRVLVAYTPDARSRTSSVLGRTMQELVDLAVLESNQGYANSGVTMRMELACLYETVFNETSAIENDVDTFRNNGDGVMDEVHTMRTNYDADMCCLIVDGTDPDWCGWAYGFSYTSYNNMFQATVFSCATGNFTFAHEFGHTQGCRHDNDGTLTPFAYAHGFRNGNNWRTIMAVAGTSSAPRLNYWSNPNINSPVAPNTAMGTAINGSNFANDNRTALNVGDNTVVNHEATPVDSSAPTGSTFATDEYADKVVTGTLTVGSFTANSGSQVQFRAGAGVMLTPGFWARNGSGFRARLASPLGDSPPAGDPAPEPSQDQEQTPTAPAFTP